MLVQIRPQVEEAGESLGQNIRQSVKDAGKE